MPVVLRLHGLRFVIFVDDHAPPHVHVRGRGEVRIALDHPCGVLTNKGMTPPDIARAKKAVREHREELLAVWTSIHG